MTKKQEYGWCSDCHRVMLLNEQKLCRTCRKPKLTWKEWNELAEKFRK